MRHLLPVFMATATLVALPERGVAQRGRTNSLDTQHDQNTLLHPQLGPLTDTSAPAWGSIPLRVGGSIPLRVSWSRSDIVLASAFSAALLMDAGQTRGLARGGWQEFQEGNPILGPRPSIGWINAYTAVAGLAVLGAAAALPARVRPWLLCAGLVVEAFTVARNAREGIAIGIP